MQNIASIAPVAIQGAANDAKQGGPGTSQGVRNLFLILQGSYGSLFLSKYSTGVKDDSGRDLGIRATMKVWDSALSKFPTQVIETAASRLTSEHPEFPPNLPQFVKTCEAVMPRKTYAEENNLKALPAPKLEPIKVDLQPKNDGKDWARRILWRVERNDKSVSKYSQREARLALGMEGRMAWQ